MGTAAVASRRRWAVLPIAVLGLLVNGGFCCGGAAIGVRMLWNHPNHPERALVGAAIFVGAGLGFLFCLALATASARVVTRPGEVELQRRVFGITVTRRVVSSRGVRAVRISRRGPGWVASLGEEVLGGGGRADAEHLAEAVREASGLPIAED